LAETHTSTSGPSADAIEAQREFYRSHPPSCLAQFHTAPADLSGYSFDGHGVILNSYWTVSCPCGGNQFKIHGYNAINPDNISKLPIFVSPISLECLACKRTALLLDTDIHGYDPVVSGSSCTIHGLRWNGATRGAYHCEDKSCYADGFSVFTRFEFSGELFDDDWEEFRGREMDLFTWFTLVADCDGCGRRSTVVEFECA
jgi:hypothetical protein